METIKDQKPGRRVVRALLRREGVFKARHRVTRRRRALGDLKLLAGVGASTPVVNPGKDRALAGKARRQARKVARR